MLFALCKGVKTSQKPLVYAILMDCGKNLRCIVGGVFALGLLRG
ncbi:hypothetical protein BN341_6570 [Helicobacter heilmannii ASB1.4]|uniref:Uncharacterized protein n=1 Tax=Helicobacter heilmannii TaxID=35817 RepID=A0A0K2Y8A1_HELHE|nr:hypothetical protein BN341_6570 [Helicobacter heilmannii ASB1.4]CRI34367.1 hypothetical protein HHE01_12130 [Helicobacter heilmannii]